MHCLGLIRRVLLMSLWYILFKLSRLFLNRFWPMWFAAYFFPPQPERLGHEPQLLPALQPDSATLDCVWST